MSAMQAIANDARECCESVDRLHRHIMGTHPECLEDEHWTAYQQTWRDRIEPERTALDIAGEHIEELHQAGADVDSVFHILRDSREMLEHLYLDSQRIERITTMQWITFQGDWLLMLLSKIVLWEEIETTAKALAD